VPSSDEESSFFCLSAWIAVSQSQQARKISLFSSLNGTFVIKEAYLDDS